MDIEAFEKIIDDEDGFASRPKVDIEGDYTILGLLLIQKYLPKSGIEGADHDIIYGADVDALVEAGITEEDAIMLRDLNWMIRDGYMAKFV